MSQNITLLGASYSDVPAVQLPKTGGGTALFTDVTDTTAAAADVATGKYFYTSAGVLTEGTSSGGGGSDTWSWMGKNPTKVATKTITYLLKDTNYVSWTPTTSQSTMVSAVTNTLQYSSADFGTYEFVAEYKFSGSFFYTNATAARVDSIAEVTYYGLFQRPNNYEKASTSQFTYNGSASFIPGYGALYYKSTSGIDAFYTSPQYGPAYLSSSSISSPTLASSGDTATIKLNAPNVYARCNSSYFSTSSAADVNQNTSSFTIEINLWRVDKLSSMYRYVWNYLIGTLNS